MATDLQGSPEQLDQAQTLLDNGKYDQAARNLQAVIQKRDRTSVEAANASYTLAVAYRAQGQIQQALQEAQLLIGALPQREDGAADDGGPTSAEVERLINVLQGCQEPPHLDHPKSA
jgi:tetratricopeptide (TPR) repeat protein